MNLEKSNSSKAEILTTFKKIDEVDADSAALKTKNIKTTTISQDDNNENLTKIFGNLLVSSKHLNQINKIAVKNAKIESKF